VIKITIRYQPDTDCNGITLNISEKVKNYIDIRTSNRSEWMKEAGSELLNILHSCFLPELSSKILGKTIITISKPIVKELEEIYQIITKDQIILSRSEFYRTAAIFKIIIDSFNDKQQTGIWKKLKDDREQGIVRIPMNRNENGETIFKAYKILKKMEY